MVGSRRGAGGGDRSSKHVAARAADTRFDPTRLVSVGLVFDQTVAGTVMVSDIGLSNIQPAFLVPAAGGAR